MEDRKSDGATHFLRTKIGMALLVFLAVAAFLLITEHRAHVFTSNGFLALLLLLCIGSHFFMHGGHGGHGGRPHEGGDRGNKASGESRRTNP